MCNKILEQKVSDQLWELTRESESIRRELINLRYAETESQHNRLKELNSKQAKIEKRQDVLERIQDKRCGWSIPCIVERIRLLL